MLQRRGRIYASRIVVPSALRGTLGRTEITRSLRTGDHREARRRLLLWEAHMGAFLHRITKHGRTMTREAIDQIYRSYLATKFDELEERLSYEISENQSEGTSFVLTDEAERLEVALASGDVSSRLVTAREMVPQAEESIQRRLARRLLEADFKAALAEIKALEGKPLEWPAELAQPASPAPAAPKASPLLSQVIDLYCEDNITRKAWTPKTANQNRRLCELFLDLLGDRPIGEVDKPMMRQLGQTIAKLPSNMSKRYPDKPPSEVLAVIGDDPEVNRLEPRSINRYFQTARGLFNWAVDNDYIDRSPAAVLKDVDAGRERDARKPFDDEDIRKLIPYIDGKSQEPFAYWIPRIMAFTGCRMGEAAQLRQVDIRQQAGIWVFDINEDHPEKNLKTDFSVRLVPIHERLIASGFLEFVASCTEEFLFPRKYRLASTEGRGDVDELSKQLGRWLRSAGIKDKKKTFQSFRATVSTRLKSHRIPDYLISQIIGHDNDNITTGRYGDDVDLPELKRVIELLALPL